MKKLLNSNVVGIFRNTVPKRENIVQFLRPVQHYDWVWHCCCANVLRRSFESAKKCKMATSFELIIKIFVVHVERTLLTSSNLLLRIHMTRSASGKNFHLNRMYGMIIFYPDAEGVISMRSGNSELASLIVIGGKLSMPHRLTLAPTGKL